MVTKKRGARIIAVTGQKGGPGKSTIVMNLAAGLSVLGYSVLIIDTDQHQATIREACAERNDSNITAVCIETKNLLKELSKPRLTSGYDIVLVDGEGHMHEASRAAIEVCHYFVCPVQPSQFDLNSFSRYVASVIDPVAMYKKISGGAVLSRTGSPSSVRISRSILETSTVPVFDAEIPESDSFKDAAGMGLCVTELRPGIKASEAFYHFLVELCEAAKINTKKITFEQFKRRAALRKTSAERRGNAKEQNNNSKRRKAGVQERTSAVYR